MIILKLRRKVLAQTHKSKSDDTKVPVRKVFPRVKIMFMLKTTEKVNGLSKKRSFNDSLSAEQGIHISSFIRIQIEEIKRKVEFSSPAALRFIGPGDNSTNLIKKGGLTNI
jgi:hypothetical protein